jgi:hypothetical protein
MFREIFFAIFFLVFVAYAQQPKHMAAETEREEWLPQKLGGRIMAGWTKTPKGSSSEWFDVYTNYDNMGETLMPSILGGVFEMGLALYAYPINIITLSAELNYKFFTSNYCYGGHVCGYRNPHVKHDRDYIAWVTIHNNTISVPALIRFGPVDGKGGFYFEYGYQWGFPFYSSMWIRKGDKFSYDEYKGQIDFSEFRPKTDQALVFGFGLQDRFVAYGLRFIYHLTELDRNKNFKAPFVIGITINERFSYIFFED